LLFRWCLLPTDRRCQSPPAPLLSLTLALAAWPGVARAGLCTVFGGVTPTFPAGSAGKLRDTGDAGIVVGRHTISLDESAGPEPTATYTSPTFSAMLFDSICEGDWRNLEFHPLPVDSIAGGDFDDADALASADDAGPYTWYVARTTADDEDAIAAYRVDGAGDAHLALTVANTQGPDARPSVTSDDTHLLHRFEVDPGDVFDLKVWVDPTGLAAGETLQVRFSEYDAGWALVSPYNPVNVSAYDYRAVLALTADDPAGWYDAAVMVADCGEYAGPSPAGADTYQPTSRRASTTCARWPTATAPRPPAGR